MQRLDERAAGASPPVPPPGLAFVGMWDYNKWPPRNSSLGAVAQLVAATPSSFLVDFARFLLAAGAPDVPDVRVRKGHHPSVEGHRMLADLLLYHLAGVMLDAMDAMDTAGGGSGGSGGGGGAACAGGGGAPRATVREWPFPAAVAGLPASRSMSWVPFQPAFGRSLLPPPCLVWQLDARRPSRW